jgi:hypothetical protein
MLHIGGSCEYIEYEADRVCLPACRLGGLEQYFTRKYHHVTFLHTVTGLNNGWCEHCNGLPDSMKGGEFLQ